MKKYLFTKYETLAVTIEIEAEDEEQLYKLADNAFDDDDDDLDSRLVDVWYEEKELTE